MDIVIKRAELSDLPFIFNLFEEAIHFQKINNYIGWLNYDKYFIETDVRNGYLYKVNKSEEILGIFCICFNDELIWRERDNADALYIHRIVLNRMFKGSKIFQIILQWATDFSIERHFKYVRMDTWALNTKLIDYYKSYGFLFVENYTTPDTPSLPIQHRNLNVALLEYSIS